MLRYCTGLQDMAKRTSLQLSCHLTGKQKIQGLASELTSRAQSCDIESRDQWSCTPAHYACLYGNANCLRILLAHDAHDYATDINGYGENIEKIGGPPIDPIQFDLPALCCARKSSRLHSPTSVITCGKQSS